MKLNHWLATAGAIVLVAGASFAQVGSTPQIYSEMVPPDKGTAEIGLSFAAVLDQSGGGTSQDLSLRYLPYLDRNIQVGGGLTYSHYSGHTYTAIEGVANYNFMPKGDASVSRTVPYAGLALGTAHSKTDGGSDNDTHWGAQVGAKHFLTHDVSVFAELNYRKYNDSDIDRTVLFIGLNTYLR